MSSEDMERSDLEGRCEELRQKIYELTLQRNTNRLTIESMEADLQHGLENRTKLFEEIRIKALNEHSKEVKVMKLQLLDIEDDIQELQAKEATLKQMYSESLKRKKQVEVVEEKKTTLPSLQSQIDCITEENTKLSADTAIAEEAAQKLLSQIKCLEKALQEARAAFAEHCASITELDSKLSALQEEKQMLQLLQESKQFAAVDPKKKGNSMFAEMDDHRRLVDERVARLQKKCEDQEKSNKVLEKELRQLVDRIEQKLSAAQDQMPPHLQKLEDEFHQAHAEQSTLIQQQIIAASKKLPTAARSTGHQNLPSFLAAKRLELQNVQQSLQNERFLSTATKDQLCQASRRFKQLQTELEIERNVEKSLMKVIKVKQEQCHEAALLEYAPVMSEGNTHKTVSASSTPTVEIKSECFGQKDAKEPVQHTSERLCETTCEGPVSAHTSVTDELIDAHPTRNKTVRFTAKSPTTLRPVRSACRGAANKCVNVRDLPTCPQQ